MTEEYCRGKNNGLTVLGSGVYAFSLITNGVMNVDTFDINRLIEFYALGLNRAMILKYSYQECLDIMRIIEFLMFYNSNVFLSDAKDLGVELKDQNYTMTLQKRIVR